MHMPTKPLRISLGIEDVYTLPLLFNLINSIVSPVSVAKYAGLDSLMKIVKPSLVLVILKSVIVI